MLIHGINNLLPLTHHWAHPSVFDEDPLPLQFFFYYYLTIKQTKNVLFLLITAPSEPPSQLSATNTTQTTISFRWSKPCCGQRNGKIMGYSYRLRNLTGGMVAQNMITSTALSIKNLTPLTKYSFSVAAKTVEGVGPFSENVIVSTTSPGQYRRYHKL